MRLIFYIVVAYFVYTLAKKFLNSSKEPLKRNKGGAVDGEDESIGKVEETVLDPVCDSYIAKKKALKSTHDNKTYYFCGTECRDKFTSERGG